MRKFGLVTLVTGLSALLLGLSAERSYAGIPNIQSCALSTNLSSGAFCPGDVFGVFIDSITPDPGIGFVCVGLDDSVLGCAPSDEWFTGPIGEIFSYDESGKVPVGSTLKVFMTNNPKGGTEICSVQVVKGDASSPECGGGLIDTDVEEPFAQINDQATPDKDTWTIRGKVTDPTASTVVSDGVESGVTVTMYESGVPATPVEGFSPFSVVDTFTFEAGECRSIANGRTLYCKDLETNSFFRARGVRSAKDPNSFRLTSVIRSQELTVNQTPTGTEPYGLPLAYEVDLSGRLWRGDTDIDYCRITQNGERTTCRLPRAGSSNPKG